MKTPHEWLTPRELKKYYSFSTDGERFDFLRFALNNIIIKGKLLDFDSLPPFINPRLKAIIKKATSIDHTKRFQSTSEFMKALFDYQKTAKNWWFEDDVIHAICPKSRTKYKIFKEKSGYLMQHSKDGVNWRKKSQGTLKELLKELE